MTITLRPDDAVFQGRERLVVLAPHPDDESLGCGGLLARAFEGAGAHVVCLTDGGASHPGSHGWPRARLAALRRSEMDRAIACLGGSRDALTWLGMEDGGLCRANPQEMAARLEALIEDVGARHIFAPAPEDHHEDHRATARFASALRSRRPDWRFYAYPVWWRWDDPDFARKIARQRPVFLPPGRHLPRKQAAIRAHRSQMGLVVADDPSGFVLPAGFTERFAQEDEIFWKMA
ncbi:PIG-L deacetylase family protein [Maritimibacter sp. DP1N21-5]|uniref:PIG-L deacetylase family protein n=1 Tax=Maritimibacter sp. DP1N21-5 TaxID=2836867 RepID=UPI001C46920C|nr:PIG-L deacetylase family protein [Maritimibacter sp. DP1N21-5]MBV7411093.1 PIG-L family deacetylase [Maritimibacter sp. DP1N21-5]